MAKIIYSLIARLVLGILLSSLLIVHWCSSVLRRSFSRSPGTPDGQSTRLVIMGTFYNLGWFKAHVTPLARCDGLDEVLVICDKPILVEMDKVIFQCPSTNLVNVVGRNLARLITVLRVGWTLHPQFYMGYHIMPNALLALLGAGLFGGKAIYQMTGGPIQIVGGGYQSENPLLRATAKPTRWLEFLLFNLVRCFDIVVVRGSEALKFVENKCLAYKCVIVTGAVDTDLYKSEYFPKDIDVLCVARLIPEKNHKRLMDVLSYLKNYYPNFNAILVGDGPLLIELKQYAKERSLEKNVKFMGRSDAVPELLSRTKVYMLLSETEGMSIAVLESMGSGVPVMVTDVGDLKDAVHHMKTGYLIGTGVSNLEIAQSLLCLLNDEVLRQSLGQASQKLIRKKYSIRSIASLWDKYLIATYKV